MDEFIKKYAFKKTFSAQAIQALLNYNWPGNVRELRNVIERLVITTTDDKLYFEEDSLLSSKTSLNNAESQPDNNAVYKGTLKDVLKAVEKQYVNQVVFNIYNYNK